MTSAKTQIHYAFLEDVNNGIRFHMMSALNERWMVSGSARHVLKESKAGVYRTVPHPLPIIRMISRLEPSYEKEIRSQQSGILFPTGTLAGPGWSITCSLDCIILFRRSTLLSAH